MTQPSPVRTDWGEVPPGSLCVFPVEGVPILAFHPVRVRVTHGVLHVVEPGRNLCFEAGAWDAWGRVWVDRQGTRWVRIRGVAAS